MKFLVVFVSLVAAISASPLLGLGCSGAGNGNAGSTKGCAGAGTGVAKSSTSCTGGIGGLGLSGVLGSVTSTVSSCNVVKDVTNMLPLDNICGITNSLPIDNLTGTFNGVLCNASSTLDCVTGSLTCADGFDFCNIITDVAALITNILDFVNDLICLLVDILVVIIEVLENVQNQLQGNLQNVICSSKTNCDALIKVARYATAASVCTTDILDRLKQTVNQCFGRTGSSLANSDICQTDQILNSLNSVSQTTQLACNLMAPETSTTPTAGGDDTTQFSNVIYTVVCALIELLKNIQAGIASSLTTTEASHALAMCTVTPVNTVFTSIGILAKARTGQNQPEMECLGNAIAALGKTVEICTTMVTQTSDSCNCATGANDGLAANIPNLNEKLECMISTLDIFTSSTNGPTTPFQEGKLQPVPVPCAIPKAPASGQWNPRGQWYPQTETAYIQPTAFDQTQSTSTTTITEKDLVTRNVNPICVSQYYQPTPTQHQARPETTESYSFSQEQLNQQSVSAIQEVPTTRQWIQQGGTGYCQPQFGQNQPASTITKEEIVIQQGKPNCVLQYPQSTPPQEQWNLQPSPQWNQQYGTEYYPATKKTTTEEIVTQNINPNCVPQCYQSTPPQCYQSTPPQTTEKYLVSTQEIIRQEQCNPQAGTNYPIQPIVKRQQPSAQCYVINTAPQFNDYTVAYGQCNELLATFNQYINSIHMELGSRLPRYNGCADVAINAFCAFVQEIIYKLNVVNVTTSKPDFSDIIKQLIACFNKASNAIKTSAVGVCAADYQKLYILDVITRLIYQCMSTEIQTLANNASNYGWQVARNRFNTNCFNCLQQVSQSYCIEQMTRTTY